MTLEFNKIEIEKLMNIIKNFNEKTYLSIDIDTFGNIKNYKGDPCGIEIWIDYRNNDYKDIRIYIFNELKFEWEDEEINFDEIENILRTF